MVIISLIGSCYVAGAQSFDFGVMGSIGTAYLANANFTASTAQNLSLTFSDNYGLQAEINLRHGSALEVCFLEGTMRQAYYGIFGSAGYLTNNSGNGVFNTYPGESYSSAVTINITQIPIAYRMINASGRYWEIGTGYEEISNTTYTAQYSNPSFSVSRNTTNEYSRENVLILVGAGWQFRISSSNFYFNFGGRLSYGVIDLQGVDAHGQYLSTPTNILYDPNNQNATPYYAKYHATHPYDLSLNGGFYYRFFPHDMHRRMLTF